ncbi:membrane protein [Caballeronia catudaia]|uniref:Membrane protein n=1 Tax=Caballeronia catudaia TaxID=1777136 RepID=A0A158CI04_9BURK|nr:MFS transporter [Caballeronia catudaia]SAK81516.1 membrane protein [Caballeronia catudaia]
MESLEQSTMRKVFRRLVPFFALCYFVSFLDRVSVGFASLQMNQAIGLTAAQYGLGSGLFFLLYFLFEVPSNLLLVRVGARIWLARIMITWGLISGATAFVVGPHSFYAVRLLLGLAEAGFFPGVAYLLTLWFPSAYRARVMGYLLVAAPLSSVIGSPISGMLLSLHGLDGLAGLQGWQWMFLIEALPALILGVVIIQYLKGAPDSVHWLRAEERGWLSARMSNEYLQRPEDHNVPVSQVFSDKRVWLLAAMAFGFFLTIYGIGFFLPQIVKSFGLSNAQTGFVTAIPYVIGSASLVFWARRSDRTRERRWNIALPTLIGAASLVGASLSGDPVVKLVLFCFLAFGMFGALPAFWAINTELLSGSAAAASIAWIGAVGNLGGFAGPYLLGVTKDLTGTDTAALMLMAVVALIAAAIALSVSRTIHLYRQA